MPPAPADEFPVFIPPPLVPPAPAAPAALAAADAALLVGSVTSTGAYLITFRRSSPMFERILANVFTKRLFPAPCD